MDEPDAIALEQRHHHPEDHRDQQPDRGAGDAGERPPQHIDLAKTGVMIASTVVISVGGSDQPGKGGDAAGDAAQTATRTPSTD